MKLLRRLWRILYYCWFKNTHHSEVTKRDTYTIGNRELTFTLTKCVDCGAEILEEREVTS